MCDASAATPRISRLLENRGTFEEHPPQPGRQTPFADRHTYQNVSTSRNIDCRTGALFGALYGLQLTSNLRLPRLFGWGDNGRGGMQIQVGGQSHLRNVELLVRWEHPPRLTTDRKSIGPGSTRKHRTVWLSDLEAYPYFFGWRLEPGDLTNGEWRLFVYDEDQLVFSDRFMVSGC